MFITLEGIEGSGKTSQIKRIAQFLTAHGHDCVVTREPGGTRIGDKIRSILLDPENEQLAPMAELLLYMADRVQHIASLIKPSLAEGKTVICDRYMDATLVYQGIARELDIELIHALHRWVCHDLKPDITLLLDLPTEAGLKRAWQQINSGVRCENETRFEKETLNFHERVRAGYLSLADKEPHRFRIINALHSEEAVQAEIQKILLPAAQSSLK